MHGSKSRAQRLAPRVFAAILASLAGLPQTVSAVTPGPTALLEFDRYVRLTEQRMEAEVRPGGAFLRFEALPAEPRLRDEALLRNGEVITERLDTRDQDREIEIPGGLIHHWVGTIFIPGGSLDQILGLVQNYDRHQQYYSPQVLKSKLIERSGDEFKVYLRLRQKDVITVVLDTEHDVRYTRLDVARAYSRSFSTRITELEHAGEPSERALSPGKDHGFLWRLDSFWRFAERDGGVYVQCEVISLTRDIPLGLGPLVGPFLESIPKASLELTLRETRDALISKINSHKSQPGGNP
jgi:hypothetical protein